jgi:hypothetical protein
MRLGKLPKVAFEPVEVVPKGITWYDREVHILNAEVIDPRWFQIPFRECGYIASGWSGDIRGDLNAERILVGFEIVCPDNEWKVIEGLKPPKGGVPGIVRVVEWGKDNDFCAFSDERKECVVFVLSPLSGERQWVQMGEGVILEVGQEGFLHKIWVFNIHYTESGAPPWHPLYDKAREEQGLG